MYFDIDIPYAQSVDDTIKMLSQEGFYTVRTEKLNFEGPMPRVELGEEGAFTVHNVITLASDQLPALAQSLAPDGLQVQVTEEWEYPDDDVWVGRFLMTVDGFAVSAKAEMSLSKEGDGCIRNLNGVAKASIPSIGPQIEALVLQNISELMSVEKIAEAAWLEAQAS